MEQRWLTTYTWPLDAETLVSFQLPAQGMTEEEVERLCQMLRTLIVNR